MLSLGYTINNREHMRPRVTSLFHMRARTIHSITEIIASRRRDNRCELILQVANRHIAAASRDLVLAKDTRAEDSRGSVVVVVENSACRKKVSA